MSLEDNVVCHFCLYNVVDIKLHFVLECPSNISKPEISTLIWT